MFGEDCANIVGVRPQRSEPGGHKRQSGRDAKIDLLLVTQFSTVPAGVFIGPATVQKLWQADRNIEGTVTGKYTRSRGGEILVRGKRNQFRLRVSRSSKPGSCRGVLFPRQLGSSAETWLCGCANRSNIHSGQQIPAGLLFTGEPAV